MWSLRSLDMSQRQDLHSCTRKASVRICTFALGKQEVVIDVVLVVLWNAAASEFVLLYQ